MPSIVGVNVHIESRYFNFIVVNWTGQPPSGLPTPGPIYLSYGNRDYLHPTIAVDTIQDLEGIGFLLYAIVAVMRDDIVYN